MNFTNIFFVTGFKALTCYCEAQFFSYKIKENVTIFSNPKTKNSRKHGVWLVWLRILRALKFVSCILKLRFYFFWSANCGYCKELLKNLCVWEQQLVNQEFIDIFALSLDDTETEIPIWQNSIAQLQGWKHIRCTRGINSPEANAYFIRSTLVMIMVDAQTNIICAKPENVQQLINAIEI